MILSLKNKTQQQQQRTMKQKAYSCLWAGRAVKDHGNCGAEAHHLRCETRERKRATDGQGAFERGNKN